MSGSCSRFASGLPGYGGGIGDGSSNWMPANYWMTLQASGPQQSRDAMMEGSGYTFPVVHENGQGQHLLQPCN